MKRYILVGHKKYMIFIMSVYIFAIVFMVPGQMRVTGNLQQVWSKSTGDFPWFQEDNATRAFAFNPVTGNVLAGSYHRNGGIYILSHDNGEVIGKLAGSDMILNNFGIVSLAVTHSGKIFASNLAYEANTVNHLYYWSSEDAGSYSHLTANFNYRVGDWMDAYEDDEGNITIILSGSQYTENPRLNYVYYDASRGSWSNTVLQTRGAPSSAENNRIVTIVPMERGRYEIWLKNVMDYIYRFDSAGNYIGRSFNPGSPTVTSNFFRTPEKGYIASTVVSRGGQVALYDADSQEVLESATISFRNANENATGRAGLAGIDGKLYVMVGVTNNSITLYRTEITVPTEVRPERAVRLAETEPEIDTGEIRWSTNLSQALNTARNQNRNVLIYFYTPQAEECQNYERYFQASLFQEKLRNYVLVRINLAENMQYSRRFNIFRVPAIIVMDSREIEQFRISRPLSREELLESL